MEEQLRSKWDELLEICIVEEQENRKVTNQRLKNLERNTGLLEQSFANLAVQVGELEFHMGILATAIGSKHTPGTFPSLPEINTKGNCHAVQLRNGTTYQPPQATDMGRTRKEREKEQIHQMLAADQTQRPVAYFHSNSLTAEPEPDPESEPASTAAAPPHNGPPEISQLPESVRQHDELHHISPPQFSSTVAIPFP